MTKSLVKEHCRPLFIKEEIITLSSLYILEAIMYGKDNLNDLVHRKQVHSYSLRQFDNFDLPRCRLTKTMKNHLVFALKVCNKFPDHIFQLDKISL